MIKSEWVDTCCLSGGDKGHGEGQSRPRGGQDGKGRAQPFLHLSALSSGRVRDYFHLLPMPMSTTH